jgi:hypothetical protein
MDVLMISMELSLSIMDALVDDGKEIRDSSSLQWDIENTPIVHRFSSGYLSGTWNQWI